MCLLSSSLDLVVWPTTLDSDMRRCFHSSWPLSRSSCARSQTSHYYCTPRPASGGKKLIERQKPYFDEKILIDFDSLRKNLRSVRQKANKYTGALKCLLTSIRIPRVKTLYVLDCEAMIFLLSIITHDRRLKCTNPVEESARVQLSDKTQIHAMDISPRFFFKSDW